jgi:hypothetical protein
MTHLDWIRAQRCREYGDAVIELARMSRVFVRSLRVEAVQ